MSQTTIALLFLAFAIVSFILEKIPLGLTATICALGLTLTGVLDASTTFAQYVNSNVILCVGMFVVGQALFETGMANKIGGIVTKFAKTEKTLVIATVIAGSCAYATPIGMPANTMVIGLGGYHFKDYVKSGLPLIGFSFVVCMVLLPILFPFYP